MTEFLEQMPILVGDVATAAHPVRRLYDEKRFHERTLPRFTWPVHKADPHVFHDLYAKIDTLAKPLWMEIGFGPGTSLSFVTPFKVRKIIACDDRPWVGNLMAFSHNPKTYALYRELVEYYSKNGPSVHDLINLRKIVGPINRWDQAGVALYLLAMAGGKAFNGSSVASSIPIVPSCEMAESVQSESFPVYPVQIVSDITELVIGLIKICKPMKRSVHFNLNRVPSGDPFKRVVDMLTKYEISWTASFLLDEITSREDLHGGKIYESGQILHVLPY